MTSESSQVDSLHQRLGALCEYERSHAIPPGTLSRWHWSLDTRRGRPALRFETRSGMRWRFTDGQKPKYDQNLDYRPCWYGIPGALKLAKSRDIHYLVDCNGAPSTVSAQSHGIPAFSLQAGETTSPSQELLDELKQAWTGPIYVAFDCDAAGRSGAVKRVKLYRSNGFEAYALDLALDKEGADLADYCAEPHDDLPDDLILYCARLPIPVEEERHPAQRTFDGEKSETTDYDLAKLAMNAIARGRADNYDDWIKVGLALFPLGDRGLSLWESWSRSGGTFKENECGKRWKSFERSAAHASSFYTLGTLFWMADQDYGPTWRPYKAPMVVDRDLKNQPPLTFEAPSKYPSSLPVDLRGPIMAYIDKRVAPVLELWLEGFDKGYMEPGEPQTIKCLVHVSKKLGRDLAEHSIRQAMNLDAVPFFKNGRHNVFLQEKNHTQDSEERDPHSRDPLTDPCKCPGRNPEWYELESWDVILSALAKAAIAPIIQKAFPPDSPIVAPIRAEFLKALGRDDAETLHQELTDKYQSVLEAQPGYREAMKDARREYRRFLRTLSNPQLAPIPDRWKYRNVAEYQACCARALIQSAGDDVQFSRKYLSEHLGCTFNALPEVLRRAGIRIDKKQYAYLPVTSVEEVRDMMTGWNKEAAGFPDAVVSSLKPLEPYGLGRKGLFQFIDGELSVAANLTMRFHQCNRQVIDTDEQPLRERKPKTDEEAAADLRPKRKRRTKVEAEPYAEAWAKKLTSTVSAWKPETGRATNMETGEIVDCQPKKVIDLLIDPKPQPAEAPWKKLLSKYVQSIHTASSPPLRLITAGPMPVRLLLPAFCGLSP